MNKKYTAFFAINFLLSILPVSSLAQQAQMESDRLKIGRKLSTATKGVILDTNQGANNPQITTNNTDNDLKLKVDKTEIGRGTSGTKRIVINRGSNNPEIRWNESTSKLEFSNDGTTFLGIGSGGGGGEGGINLLTNPDLELGVTINFTASSGPTVVEQTGSNALRGSKSARFTATAGNQTYASDLYSIPVRLQGNNCVATVYYRTSENTNKYVLEVVDNSAVTLASFNLDATASSGTLVSIGYTTFRCPSSGTIKVQARSTGVAAALDVDDFYLGSENKIVQVSQSRVVAIASQVGAAGCNYGENTSTSETNFVSLGTGSGCNPWTTTGNATAVGTNDHRITLSNVESGTYEVSLIGTAAISASGVCNFRLTDGTNNYGSNSFSASGGGTPTLQYLVSVPNAQSSMTFQIQASDSAAVTCSLDNTTAGRTLTWIFKRFPTQAQTAVSLDTTAASWSGYHSGISAGCSTTSTTYADPSSCTGITLTQSTNRNFGTVTTAAGGLPGITFTPNKAGIYDVCATVSIQNTAATTNNSVRLVNGSGTALTPGVSTIVASTGNNLITQCAQVDITSTTSSYTVKAQIAAQSSTAQIRDGFASGSAAILWKIIQLDTPIPAPVIANTIYSGSTTSSIRLVSAVFVCGTTASLTRQSENWISSVSVGTTGLCTVNIAAGIFGSAPTCTTGLDWTSTLNDGQVAFTAAPTTSTIALNVSNGAGGVDGKNVHLMCMGTR